MEKTIQSLLSIVAEPQRKADCQVDTNLTTEDSDSETCTLKDDKNEINEEGQTLNERIDSCKRNESKYFFKENNDGYVEICSPGNMNIYDLSKILGFESGGYAIKGIYAAKHKHKLNKMMIITLLRFTVIYVNLV